MSANPSRPAPPETSMAAGQVFADFLERLNRSPSAKAWKAIDVDDRQQIRQAFQATVRALLDERNRYRAALIEISTGDRVWSRDDMLDEATNALLSKDPA